MLTAFREWRHRRVIKHSAINTEEWALAFARLPILHGLSEDERQRLQELAILLIHYKSFEAAKGLLLTQEMIVHIALQASLPILNLGFSSYDGWVSVIVYPEAFFQRRSHMDEAGVVSEDDAHLAGESWLRGPVILGWQDASVAGEVDGHNLVIHEFAHKLDMQNGAANGFPPLHSTMVINDWIDVFSQAYAHFKQHCHGREYCDIDCYAATSPAEFFAVFSEVFFERPEVLQRHYPEVSQQLRLFYRQDPLKRLNTGQASA
jgi:Mlc titration factor MtfA (ptsG expression regulator)